MLNKYSDPTPPSAKLGVFKPLQKKKVNKEKKKKERRESKRKKKKKGIKLSNSFSFTRSPPSLTFNKNRRVSLRITTYTNIYI